MSGLAYYNECDPYAAEWLRNLIAAGLITPGDVDERSIVDVRPSDLAGCTQFHTFAGIAGWSLALRLAGVPDDFPVWTGSCPCQPFSAAGRRGGFSDDRHLWPAWFELIRACRPALVFGEQVASADGLGWLDAVFADLEGEGYACRAADLCAAGAGAPHIRQRLWFVAYAQSGAGRKDGETLSGDSQRSFTCPQSQWRTWRSRRRGRAQGNACRGHKWAAEPNMGRVAHGVSGGVDQLRAFGNAIVPQVAAAFIGAVIDTLTPTPGGLAEGER